MRRFRRLAALAIFACAAAATQAATPLLDINTATVAQLKSLPGMGEAYARRVIAGRPYTAKNQLVTRGILPQQVYAKLQAGIVARRIVK
jgi:DNA uptake protein ComE-like DNA-binding protein